MGGKVIEREMDGGREREGEKKTCLSLPDREICQHSACVKASIQAIFGIRAVDKM